LGEPLESLDLGDLEAGQGLELLEESLLRFGLLFLG
jgi:hypothetical protein